MPRYVYYIVFACAFGGCSGEDTQDEPSVESQCICKPTMKLSFDNEASSTGYMCNDKTFDWVVKAMVTKVAQQVDQVEALQAHISQLTQELKRQQDISQETTHRLHECEEEMNTQKEASQSVITKLKDELRHRNQADIKNLKTFQYKANSSPKDCADIQNLGYHDSGLYTIYPSMPGHNTEQGIQVLCDFHTDQGGWLVLQRRQDGSVSFERSWDDYKIGFGDLAKEFWIGNEVLHQLTQQRHYELRVDLTDFNGISSYALYDSFAIESEEHQYTLRLGLYQGNAGDSLGHHNDQAFSTADRDNDLSKSGNCAELYRGGWWYVRCYDSNLNGLYLDYHAMEGVVWFHLEHNHTPLRHVEMKIRPYKYIDGTS